jgi:hypothetical protein
MQGVVALAGYGGAVVAFLLALRQAWTGAMSLRMVLTVAMLLHGLALALPLLASQDAFLYGMYGRMAGLHHVNPYVASPLSFRSDPIFPFVGSPGRQLSAFYGPAFILLSTVLARAIRSVNGLIFAYKLLSATASIGTLLLIAAVARRLHPGRAPFATLLFGWNPLVLLFVVGGGHNDAMVALAIAIAFWLAVREREGTEPGLLGRELLTTAALTLGFLVKFAVAIPLILWIDWAVFRRDAGRRLRPFTAHAGLAAGLSLAFYLPFWQVRDPTYGIAKLSEWGNFLTPAAFVLLLFVLSLASFPSTLAPSPGLRSIRYAFVAGFVAMVALLSRSIARRAKVLSPEHLGAIWTWALLLFLLTLPLLQPWYLVWLLPLLWLLPRTPFVATLAFTLVLPSFVVVNNVRSSGVYDTLVPVAFLVLDPVSLVFLYYVVRELWRWITGDDPIAADLPDAPVVPVNP